MNSPAYLVVVSLTISLYSRMSAGVGARAHASGRAQGAELSQEAHVMLRMICAKSQRNASPSFPGMLMWDSSCTVRGSTTRPTICTRKLAPRFERCAHLPSFHTLQLCPCFAHLDVLRIPLLVECIVLDDGHLRIIAGQQLDVLSVCADDLAQQQHTPALEPVHGLVVHAGKGIVGRHVCLCVLLLWACVCNCPRGGPPWTPTWVTDMMLERRCACQCTGSCCVQDRRDAPDSLN